MVVVTHFAQVGRGGERPCIGEIQCVPVWLNFADEIGGHATGSTWFGFNDDGLTQYGFKDSHQRPSSSICCTPDGVTQYHADGFIRVALGLSLQGNRGHQAQGNERDTLEHEGPPKKRTWTAGQSTRSTNLPMC